MSTLNTDWIDENSSSGRARNGLFAHSKTAEKKQRGQQIDQEELVISSVTASALTEAKKHTPYG